MSQTGNTEPEREAFQWTHAHGYDAEKFILTDEWREKLDTLAPEYYEKSKQDGNYETLKEIEEQFTGGRWAVGKGSGRLVVTLPDDGFTGGEYYEYVVKIAQHNDCDTWDGRAQNELETTHWDEVEDEDFVPVISADTDGHYWVIMPKGEHSFDDEIPEYNEWERRVESEYAPEYVAPQDIISRNVVVIDGSYKFCDYGCTNVHPLH